MSKRSRHRNFLAYRESTMDDAIAAAFLGHGVGRYDGQGHYGAWDDELSTEEADRARPTPLPVRLLANLIGAKEDEAFALVNKCGYTPRVLTDHTYSYRLKRDRINLRLDKDKTVMLAFVG